MIKLSTPNHAQGRNGHKVKAVVLHITEGNLQGDLNHLRNPNTQVSYHYLVDNKTAEVYQLVKEEDTAWHAGIVKNPSWRGLKAVSLGSKENYRDEEDFIGEKGSKHSFVNHKLGGSTSVVNPNYYTIGVALSIPNGRTFPNWKAFKKLASLVKDIQHRHDAELVNHREIRDDKFCPGLWNRRFYLSFIIKHFI